MAQSEIVLSDWFKTKKISDWLYLTTEPFFEIGNRANIWLVKGSDRDIVIDTGLGVCNLKAHLEGLDLIDSTERRPCDVVCTHAHFDHSGGAHHFKSVCIHELEADALAAGAQRHTLNYVKSNHFHKSPYSGFSARRYRVPPTVCKPLRQGDVIALGSGDQLEVMHTPGHTVGSISLYLSSKRALFTGDFLYDCGVGSHLLDWLPTSNCRSYSASAESMIDFIDTQAIQRIYPGHFNTLNSTRALTLLREYITDRAAGSTVCSSGCLQSLTTLYFAANCFRCCPC